MKYECDGGKDAEDRVDFFSVSPPVTDGVWEC